MTTHLTSADVNMESLCHTNLINQYTYLYQYKK